MNAKESGENKRVRKGATLEGLGVEKCGHKGEGGFKEWREGVTIGWGLVDKHVGEKVKDLVVVVNVLGSNESVIEKSRHPFFHGMKIMEHWVIKKVVIGDYKL
ncbi:hydrolase [Sesbania bispinosa]|nr:hydrolase [Sesbania bispinosa]